MQHTLRIAPWFVFMIIKFSIHDLHIIKQSNLFKWNNIANRNKHWKYKILKYAPEWNIFTKVWIRDTFSWTGDVIGCLHTGHGLAIFFHWSSIYAIQKIKFSSMWFIKII